MCKSLGARLVGDAGMSGLALHDVTSLLSEPCGKVGYASRSRWGGHPLGALAAASVAGAAGRARISERAYNHPMRTARGHHRAASGVAGRPWAREKRFRVSLRVTDNGTYKC